MLMVFEEERIGINQIMTQAHSKELFFCELIRMSPECRASLVVKTSG